MPDLDTPPANTTPNHWQGSTRAARLPPNWRTIRTHVLDRHGYTCQIRGRRCTITATQVDHIVHGDDHTLGNLQAVCVECHKDKTASEAQAAKPSRYRQPELHPNRRHAV